MTILNACAQKFHLEILKPLIVMVVPMDYEKIPGWFDFAGLYAKMVDLAPNKARFVEIGAWYGKSTVCMAELISGTKKDIQFLTVDNWSGMKGEDTFNSDVYSAFIKNTEPWKEFINFAVMDSLTAALNTTDLSCDFVFIDGSHEYKDVKKDIKAWLPKVKIGGYIGGHDYTSKHPGVMKAVQELIGTHEVMCNSWLYKV